MFVSHQVSLTLTTIVEVSDASDGPGSVTVKRVSSIARMKESRMQFNKKDEPYLSRSIFISNAHGISNSATWIYIRDQHTYSTNSGSRMEAKAYPSPQLYNVTCIHLSPSDQGIWYRELGIGNGITTVSFFLIFNSFHYS